MHTSPPRSTQRIGSDHVILREDRLVVISRAHMDAWRVRSYRQTQIVYDGRPWRVIGTRAVPPDATEYTLEPWNLSDHDVVGATIYYGPTFVADRDRAAVVSRRTRRATGMLRLVAPLTGFLRGRIKDRLEETYGIDCVASTKQSVIIETMASLAALAAFQTGVVTDVVPAVPFLIVVLLVLLDAAVRWGRVLSEQRPPPGFFEWMLPRSR